MSLLTYTSTLIDTSYFYFFSLKFKTISLLLKSYRVKTSILNLQNDPLFLTLYLYPYFFYQNNVSETFLPSFLESSFCQHSHFML